MTEPLIERARKDLDELHSKIKGLEYEKDKIKRDVYEWIKNNHRRVLAGSSFKIETTNSIGNSDDYICHATTENSDLYLSHHIQDVGIEIDSIHYYTICPSKNSTFLHGRLSRITELLEELNCPVTEIRNIWDDELKVIL